MKIKVRHRKIGRLKCNTKKKLLHKVVVRRCCIRCVFCMKHCILFHFDRRIFQSEAFILNDSILSVVVVKPLHFFFVEHFHVFGPRTLIQYKERNSFVYVISAKRCVLAFQVVTKTCVLSFS